MTTLETLRTLPLSERIQLVEDLWDSIAGTPDSVGLTAAQCEELDRRLARHEEEAGAARDWADVKKTVLRSRT